MRSASGMVYHADRPAYNHRSARYFFVDPTPLRWSSRFSVWERDENTMNRELQRKRLPGAYRLSLTLDQTIRWQLPTKAIDETS